MADAEPRWLSPLEQRQWRTYLRGSALLADRLDRDLHEAHGISLADYEILSRLSEAEGRSIRMALLAEGMAFSRSRTTQTVGRLEAHGWLRRERSAEDGRGISAVLTDAGWELLDRAARTHVAGVREHFVDQASPEEFAVLARVFDNVVRHVTS